MKHNLSEELEIMDGVSVSFHEGVFTVKGPKGEIKRKLYTPRIKTKIEGKTITFESLNATQREKKMIMTYLAHIRGMFTGVTVGHAYKLKVCASHFPITVTVKGNVLEIKNFFGEQVPRLMNIPKGVSIKSDGQFLTVDGIEKELVSQAAAQIEQTTKRPGFDKRIFQDGIYLIEKDGKPIK